MVSAAKAKLTVARISAVQGVLGGTLLRLCKILVRHQRHLAVTPDRPVKLIAVSALFDAAKLTIAFDVETFLLFNKVFVNEIGVGFANDCRL